MGTGQKTQRIRSKRFMANTYMMPINQLQKNPKRKLFRNGWRRFEIKCVASDWLARSIEIKNHAMI